jgi:glucosamine-6-phosphate deaminase
MRVRIFSSPQSVAHALARHVARAISAKPSLVLGLPTGRTPIPFYRELIRLHRLGRLDCARLRTFNLDEFLGVAPADPHSYRAYMQRHFFAHVNIAAGHIHFLDGISRDVERECRRYERAIERAGDLDLLILGLGTNGHIGFNEPAPALIARTHRTHLSAATRRANTGLFGGRLRAVPREALSMGMATILHARRIVLMATGATKARAVARMVLGPVTPRVPASFLQLHRHAEVWLDQTAADRMNAADRFLHWP